MRSFILSVSLLRVIGKAYQKRPFIFLNHTCYLPVYKQMLIAINE
jgi:hypothetical protein